MPGRQTVVAAMTVLFATRIAAAQTEEERRRMEEMEKQALKEKVDTLMERTRHLQEPGKDTPITATFKDGFKFKSADGNFDGYIGGRFLEHARFVLEREDTGGNAPAPDTFFVRQARLEMAGTFYKDFEFKVQADFPTPGASGTLQDGYIGWKAIPELSLRFGQMKEPFSQEEATTTRFIDFVERSNVNRLVPARDIGLAAHGKFLDGILDYEIGAYNGSGRAAVDANDEKDIAARIRLNPFITGDTALTRQLRLGLAFTIGDQDPGSAQGDLTSTETGTRFVDFGAAATLDGTRTRVGFDVSWLYGPFSLRAEYVLLSEDTAPVAATGADEIELDGFYVAATFILTGEDKPLENRIVPKNPFSLSTGGWGAVELAIRLAIVEADGVVDDGYVTAGWLNESVQSITVGANWYLTRNFRTSLNFVQNRFDEDIAAGDPFDSEQALLMRFQIDF